MDSKICDPKYYDLLFKATEQGTPAFSLGGRKTWAKVVDVYDGDSCWVAVDFGMGLFRYPLRMEGYDTPEIRSKDQDEKISALLVRDELRKLILDKIVWLEVVETDKPDKYGRLLSRILVPDRQTDLNGSCKFVNVKDWILKHNYGVPYDGGNKAAAWNINL